MRRAQVPANRFLESRALMDTVVTIGLTEATDRASPAVERAYKWFGYVERICSRFDPDSEVVRLSSTAGRPVAVSPLLFQAVSFALALGRLSGGAFDVRIGALMESRGLDLNYRSRRRHRFGASGGDAFGEVLLDAEAQTVTLTRPLLLDLGAIAKGLAIDLAARELAGLGPFSIDAGGDLYVSGRSQPGGWRIGIQHPESGDQLAEILEVTDAAVCTSGGYRRPAEPPGQHHIVDPRTRVSPSGVWSATVVAPNAMLADGLSTALFVLGSEGLGLVEGSGAHGLVIGGESGRYATAGFDSILLEAAA